MGRIQSGSLLFLVVTRHQFSYLPRKKFCTKIGGSFWFFVLKGGNIGDCTQNQNSSIDTKFYPSLFWLDSTFKLCISICWNIFPQYYSYSAANKNSGRRLASVGIDFTPFPYLYLLPFVSKHRDHGNRPVLSLCLSSLLSLWVTGRHFASNS